MNNFLKFSTFNLDSGNNESVTVGCSDRCNLFGVLVFESVMSWSKQPSSLPRNWGVVRRRVLRASKVCYLCGGVASEVDHIINRANGGTDDLSNLRPICKSCHAKKSSLEGHSRKQSLRELRSRPSGRHPGVR